MVKKLIWLLVAAISLVIAGCHSDFGPVLTETDSILPTQVAIQAGDKIKVAVYGQADLSGIYEVNPSGSVTLPLAGTIRAAGRTRAELEREITGRYKSKLQEPQVTVELAELRPFYIMGEVHTPGQYPYRSGLNALTAISTAGGLTYRGSRATVFVQHAGEQAWREFALTSAVVIAPGDLIRVPERYF